MSAFDPKQTIAATQPPRNAYLSQPRNGRLAEHIRLRSGPSGCRLACLARSELRFHRPYLPHLPSWVGRDQFADGRLPKKLQVIELWSLRGVPSLSHSPLCLSHRIVVGYRKVLCMQVKITHTLAHHVHRSFGSPYPRPMCVFGRTTMLDTPPAPAARAPQALG